MTLDTTGRIVAGPQSEPAPRPAGPWDDNSPAPFTFQRDGRTFVCVYHPGFAAPDDDADASHGCCDACYDRQIAEMDAEDAR